MFGIQYLGREWKVGETENGMLRRKGPQKQDEINASGRGKKMKKGRERVGELHEYENKIESKYTRYKREHVPLVWKSAGTRSDIMKKSSFKYIL